MAHGTLPQTPSFQSLPDHLERCLLIPNTAHLFSEEGAVRWPWGGQWGQPWRQVLALPGGPYQLISAPSASVSHLGRVVACLFFHWRACLVCLDSRVSYRAESEKALGSAAVCAESAGSALCVQSISENPGLRESRPLTSLQESAPS